MRRKRLGWGNARTGRTYCDCENMCKKGEGLRKTWAVSEVKGGESQLPGQDATPGAPHPQRSERHIGLRGIGTEGSCVKE